ncbi:patatin-like phospholipase family protein [Deinococcus multiflagellatus]|nr:patatin-like phospholipase family protein [Deinococcus multiflagellatus]
MRKDPAAAVQALLAWGSGGGALARTHAALAGGRLRGPLLALLGGSWGTALTPLLGTLAPGARPWGALTGVAALALLALLLLTAAGTALLARWCPAWAASLWALVLALVLVGLVLYRWATGWVQEARALTGALGEDGRALLAQAQTALGENAFGLATGYGRGEASRLTPWLHRHLQQLSGQTEVLTFGHLRAQGTELKLVTSCLSRQRPYVLPLAQNVRDAKNLYFRPEEWAHYFPPEVIAALIAGSERAFTAPEATRPGASAQATPGLAYYRLPPEQHLPVLVAARLSMSFPLLFSALPLHFIRYERPWSPAALRPGEVWTWRAAQDGQLPQVQATRLRAFAVLFSDGGLTSNFPLMLFDEPVPKRPLLALNLQYRAKDQPVFLAGADGRWQPYNTHIQTPGQFAGALLDTARLWFDQSLLSLPGYAEQTACITLGPGLGGLNLGMTPDQIRTLLDKGRGAAQVLGKRFGTPGQPWGQEALKAFVWRNVVADLGELLLEYDGAYTPAQLPPLLRAMPSTRQGEDLPGQLPGKPSRPFTPNADTLTPPEWAALTAIAAASAQVQAARTAQPGGAFAARPPWNKAGEREARAFLRHRPFL